MGCPSIERAIRLTTLDLIDIWTEPFLSANRHITLVCKLVAELPSAKGLFNIHEGAFKGVRQLSPPSTTTAARFPTSLLPTHTVYLALTHTADTQHAGSLRQTCGLTKSCHAALNLPWHFLIDFL